MALFAPVEAEFLPFHSYFWT